MKFEKINKDKIKVTINTDDLANNDIDLHSFMSDSEETHSLFLDVLDKAEKDLGFVTKDYNLRVETIADSDGFFILTITRLLDDNDTVTTISSFRKKPKAKIKSNQITASLIYKFNNFDDFCDFTYIYLNDISNKRTKISQDSTLIFYNNEYYLVLNNINTKFKGLKKTIAELTEFASYIDYSDVLVAKLSECGKTIFEHNAFESCKKYFAN